RFLVQPQLLPSLFRQAHLCSIQLAAKIEPKQKAWFGFNGNKAGVTQSDIPHQSWSLEWSDPLVMHTAPEKEAAVLWTASGSSMLDTSGEFRLWTASPMEPGAPRWRSTSRARSSSERT